MSADTVISVPKGSLVALRGELAELAFEFDQRGAGDAADLAMMIAARLGELCAEAGAPVDTELPSA